MGTEYVMQHYFNDSVMDHLAPFLGSDTQFAAQRTKIYTAGEAVVIETSMRPWLVAAYSPTTGEIFIKPKMVTAVCHATARAKAILELDERTDLDDIKVIALSPWRSGDASQLMAHMQNMINDVMDKYSPAIAQISSQPYKALETPRPANKFKLGKRVSVLGGSKYFGSEAYVTGWYYDEGSRCNMYYLRGAYSRKEYDFAIAETNLIKSPYGY
jgi:hypothetical protein